MCLWIEEKFSFSVPGNFISHEKKNTSQKKSCFLILNSRNENLLEYKIYIFVFHSRLVSSFAISCLSELNISQHS